MICVYIYIYHTRILWGPGHYEDPYNPKSPTPFFLFHSFHSLQVKAEELAERANGCREADFHGEPKVTQ